MTEWSTDNYVIGGCTDSGIGRNFRNKLSVERISVEYDIPLQSGWTDYNQTLVDKVQDADLRGNVDRRVFEERWQKPGDKVMFTKFGPGINANATSLTKPTSVLSRITIIWNCPR